MRPLVFIVSLSTAAVADISLHRTLVGAACVRKMDTGGTYRAVSEVQNAYRKDPEGGQCLQVLGWSRAETSLSCQLGWAAVADPSDPVSLQG